MEIKSLEAYRLWNEGAETFITALPFVQTFFKSIEKLKADGLLNDQFYLNNEVDNIDFEAIMISSFIIRESHKRRHPEDFLRFSIRTVVDRKVCDNGGRNLSERRTLDDQVDFDGYGWYFFEQPRGFQQGTFQAGQADDGGKRSRFRALYGQAE